MKNRIVYFGDSFVADKFYYDNLLENIKPDDLWTNQLAKKLNVPSLNLARAGTGMDNILTNLQFELFKKNISSDDLIVLGLTSWDRKWLIRDYPEASHLSNLEIASFRDWVLKNQPANMRPQISMQMKIAYDYYIHSWNNPLSYVENCAFNSHLIWLRDKFDLSIITLPTFEYTIQNGKEYIPDPNEGYYEVTGFLNNSSLKEFSGDYEKVRDHYLFNIWGNGTDKRANHLSTQNHNILADKLYRTIAHNEPLDLEKDFIKDIYKL